MLPVASAELPARGDPAAAVRGGSETVLLVDDDAAVRRGVREILVRGGYAVVEAHDGPTGLELFERERIRIDLVILDRSMPQLSGDAVLERFDALDSGVPIILLSGHPGATGGGGRAGAVLTKPTDRATLLRTVRDVLDRD